jgi:hypothetical protein
MSRPIVPPRLDARSEVGQPKAMPASILPSRGSSPVAAGPAIQPKMNLAAIVAPGS